MVSLKASERITILAGAGLAKDAGLPTSIELAAELRTTLQKMCTDSVPRTILEQHRVYSWLSLLNFLDGAIRFQEGVMDGDPDLPINIEQIAVAAEELQNRMLSPLAPYSSGWHSRIIELEREDRQLLPTFTAFIYSQLERWLTLKNEQSASYIARTVDICYTDKARYKVDLFTLNYDLCIECSLTAGARDFQNGFSIKGTWDPRSLEQDAKIRLFKLHGSLDWVEDSVYGVCSLSFPRHEDAETLKGDDTKPLLIFGTAHKLSAREPFFTLAYRFAHAVLSTPLLVIIGYSFGDEYVNEIIDQGIRKNQKLRVLVVSPHADKQVARKNFLRGYPRVSTINEQASTALNANSVQQKIIELLKESSAEEPF